MRKEEIEKKVAELKKILDYVFLARNSVFAIIRMLFLKYITDNFVGAQNEADKQEYAKMQESFTKKDFFGAPNLLIVLFSIVGREYGLETEKCLRSSLNDYAMELFCLDEQWQRKIANESDIKRIVDKISEIDLTEEKIGSHTIGIMLVEEFREMLYNADYRNISGFITSKSVIQVVKKILNVKESETFLDFASGIGLSTIEIVGDHECEFYNSDVAQEPLALSAMLYILYGYKNFHLNNKNYDEQSNNGLEVDKVFVDPPFGLKMKECFGYSMDSVSKAVEMASAHLNNFNMQGLAVITVNSKYLFGASESLRFSKQCLVANGSLKAIVSLPINVIGSMGITVNLIVLSSRKNEEITFVNACGRLFSKYVTRNKKENIISEEGIDKIVELVNYNISEEGISRVVSVEEILNNGFDLMPSRYVKEIRSKEEMTLEELDNRLAALYAKIGIDYNKE